MTNCRVDVGGRARKKRCLYHEAANVTGGPNTVKANGTARLRLRSVVETWSARLHA